MNNIDRQVKLEADAIHDGILRFAERREYQLATDSKPTRDLVGKSLDSLANAILAEQTALKSSSERRKLPQYGLPLLSINHEKLALISLGTLLNAISLSEFQRGLPPAVTAVAKEIGHRCRIERSHDCMRRRQVDVARELLSRNRNRNAARRAAELAQKVDDPDDWLKNYRSYQIGEKLIALAVQFAHFDGEPLFELETVREGDAKGIKTTHTIALTRAASDWIANHPSTLASLPSPVHLPMVMRPRQWTSLAGGGYIMNPLQLLKRESPLAKALLGDTDLSAVFSAVNAMQNTAYRINKDIYRDMCKAWDADNMLFGLKTHTFVQLPPRLAEDADPRQIGQRHRERADAFNTNNRIKGFKRVMTLRLSLAKRLLDEPQIYFPHQLDHRGRAYPVPQLMNPQSDNIGRSLLEFAEGKPLGERGAYWLAIHVANCYGINKVSFDDRVAWVHQHEQEIMSFAADPVRPHRFWDESDKQWMFLAACKEWKRYLEEGPNFRSHLPVSVDGTCNGYQHLSAMGRDPIGGQATNLIPGDKPADVYQQVADRVNWRIRTDAENGGGREARARQSEALMEDTDAARQLLAIRAIDRSDVKHATMTTPYGVTRRTIYKQLVESRLAMASRDPKKCASYLARVLEECIPEVAVEAGKIMDYLRNVARILAGANRGMVWTTPTGFRVVHEIREPKPVRVATSDRTLLIYIEDETRKIDWRKQADGVVAHLVHSFDAAHMMLTINRLEAEGIHHFAMVHDSFGVHAADIDVLNRVLREEFLRIYSESVLQNFLDEQRTAHPDVRLPDCPQTGNLDINQVLSSPYFFA